MKKHLLALFVAAATTVSAETIPGQELLSYFQSNCKSSGEWTQLALSDSQALLQTLRSISSDPDCTSVSGAISNLNLLTRQLNNLQNVNATQKKISDLNYQEQELMLQLSQSSSDDVKLQLGSALRDVQVQRASYLGQEKAQKDLSDPSRAQVMNDVVQIANSTLNQIASNQRCLSKHPNVLNSATSIVATIGATVSVINPALGIGLSAGATLLGTTVEGIRQNKLNRDLRKISNYSVAFEGYKCALETMSDRYCQIKDADRFLNFKINQRMKPGISTDLAQAVRLNDREIPVILEWLNRIKSGVTPTTSADAMRQANVFDRENKVRSFLASGVGAIEEGRVLYDLATTTEDKWTILKNIINRLVPSQYMMANASPSYTNPMFDVLPVGYAPFFLLDINDDAGVQNPQTSEYYTLDTWPGRKNYVPNLNLTKQKFLSWVELAQKRVNQELTQVLQPDATQTISSAFDRSGNRWKLSPMDSLKNVIAFIEANPSQEADGAFEKIYKNTLEKLKNIYDISLEFRTTEGTDALNRTAAQAAVERIYEVAMLKYGTVVIDARLDLIVRLSLIELLDKVPSQDQSVVAQILAADQLTDTLKKMSGTDNLAMIRQDLRNAQPIAMENLNSFGELFGKNISAILKKLQKDELASSGTIAKAYRNQRTQMCYLTLSVPQATKFIDTDLCLGLKIEELVPGGPSAPVIAQESFTQDLDSRACVYRDFFRQNKIFENWSIQPK